MQTILWYAFKDLALIKLDLACNHCRKSSQVRPNTRRREHCVGRLIGICERPGIHGMGHPSCKTGKGGGGATMHRVCEQNASRSNMKTGMSTPVHLSLQLPPTPPPPLPPKGASPTQVTLNGMHQTSRV